MKQKENDFFKMFETFHNNINEIFIEDLFRE